MPLLFLRTSLFFFLFFCEVLGNWRKSERFKKNTQKIEHNFKSFCLFFFFCYLIFTDFFFAFNTLEMLELLFFHSVGGPGGGGGGEIQE